jgi:hypothetical protein
VLNLAPYLQYKGHRNFGIPPIAAQIRSVEYWSLNMRSCNSIVYMRVHSSYRVNCMICAVFGTMVAVERALNCRDISNSSADTCS